MTTLPHLHSLVKIKLTYYHRSKIVVTSRRPLLYYWQDPRIEFVAVDFLDPLKHIIETLRAVCKEVTHAYFTSYVHVADFNALRDKNVPLFRNFLEAVNSVAPNLQRVSLQTGCKVSEQFVLQWKGKVG